MANNSDFETWQIGEFDLEKLGDWPTDREIQWQFMRPDRVVHFASGTKLSNYERFEETFQVFLFFFRSR